ncbi:MAG: type IV pilus modification protein PilV [Pseudomonadota bacterium]
MTLTGKQQGFTLIEALIAFVILSVGLLGIVSLQAMAKTSQHLAIQHTRAVTLADAIVERIRVNPGGIATYNIGLNNPIDGTEFSAEPSPDCKASPCSATELANYDLWLWEQALMGEGATVSGEGTAGLIEPHGCILFSPAPGRTRSGQLTVIVQWRGVHESYDAVQFGQDVCNDESVDPGTDRFRRQVISNTYIVDESEF